MSRKQMLAQRRAIRPIGYKPKRHASQCQTTNRDHQKSGRQPGERIGFSSSPGVMTFRQEKKKAGEQQVKVFFHRQGPRMSPDAGGSVVLHEQQLGQDLQKIRRVMLPLSDEDGGKNQRPESRINLETSPNQKSACAEGAKALMLPEQKTRHQKTAQNKKKVNPHPSATAPDEGD